MNILNLLTYICLALGVIGIGISVYLWFRLDIYKVWCAYTGRTKRKELEDIKKHKVRATDKKDKAGKKKEAEQVRASAAEVNQIWSESKVLSDTTEAVTEYDLDEGEGTEMMPQGIRSNSTETEGTTENLLMGLGDVTEILYGPGTVVLSQLNPETMVMPEERTEPMMPMTDETTQMYDTGTEELSMDELKKADIPSEALASSTFVVLDEEQTMPIRDEDRIVL